jgi:hypothetical protein
MQLKDVMQTRNETYVGTCDSLLPFYFEALAETCHGFHLAVIKRDLEDSINSYAKSFGTKSIERVTMICEQSIGMMDNLINKYNPLVLDFKDLNDEKKIEELWYYCVPELEFDVARYRMLDAMKVEPHVDKYLKEINMDNVISIMGG